MVSARESRNCDDRLPGALACMGPQLTLPCSTSLPKQGPSIFSADRIGFHTKLFGSVVILAIWKSNMEQPNILGAGFALIKRNKVSVGEGNADKGWHGE